MNSTATAHLDQLVRDYREAAAGVEYNTAHGHDGTDVQNETMRYRQATADALRAHGYRDVATALRREREARLAMRHALDRPHEAGTLEDGLDRAVADFTEARAAVARAVLAATGR